MKTMVILYVNTAMNIISRRCFLELQRLGVGGRGLYETGHIFFAIATSHFILNYLCRESLQLL